MSQYIQWREYSHKEALSNDSYSGVGLFAPEVSSVCARFSACPRRSLYSSSTSKQHTRAA